jgi:hypothetical protein
MRRVRVVVVGPVFAGMVRVGLGATVAGGSVVGRAVVALAMVAAPIGGLVVVAVAPAAVHVAGALGAAVDDRVARGDLDRLGVPEQPARVGLAGLGRRRRRREPLGRQGRGRGRCGGVRLCPRVGRRRTGGGRGVGRQLVSGGRRHRARRAGPRGVELTAQRLHLLLQGPQLLAERLVRGPRGGRDVVADVDMQRLDLVFDVVPDRLRIAT